MDALSGLDTNTKFSVFGSSGHTIQKGFQDVGPMFVLERGTRITEIGGWVNNCGGTTLSFPACPNTKPVIVQIHPDKNGVPDPDIVLATIELSHDNDPLTVAFESGVTHLSLPAGTYYALFTTQQPDDQGFILLGAQDPFFYRASPTPFGYVTSTQPPYTTVSFGAVRILGETM